MKEHYRSEWHRHNLKRKVAGLAPLAREAFEERAAREREREGAAGAATASSHTGASGGMTRSQQRRLKREAKQQEKQARAASNPNSKASHYQATQTMSEMQFVEHKMASAAPFDEGSDLFSRHQSASLAANLAYMAKTHGFYVPYMDYVTDLPGLITYLLEMVYVGNVAILSGKQFHSLEACQSHMRDKNACRMELEGHEEEYEAFYDMEALALKSPLWEWVEEEVDDDDDDGWEDVDDGKQGEQPLQEGDAVAMETESGSGSGAAGPAAAKYTLADPSSLSAEQLEDLLSELLDECVRVGLLSEAEVDQMTDRVATGETTDAALYTEWSETLRSHLASSPAAPDAPDAMSVSGSVRSTALRVRYRPIGGSSGASAEAGTLTIGPESRPNADGQLVERGPARELGHRSMRAYYRQRYRPGGGDALGATNPELHALMLQYAQAGVLPTPMPRMRLGGHSGVHNEQSRATLQRTKKMFVAQGLNNNSTMSGMKHFKNQSLTF